jgi:hypothetical protein
LRNTISVADQVLIQMGYVSEDRMKRFVMAGMLASAVATLVATQSGNPSACLGPATADTGTPATRARDLRAAVVAQVYNWGGFYFGANAGYGFGTSNWTDPNNHSGHSSTGDFGLSGFVVGPTVGVNFQTDAFVYGAEADFDGSWIHGGSSNAFCANVGFRGGQCDTKSFFISTGRARFGYAADRVLFYGTGGASYCRWRRPNPQRDIRFWRSDCRGTRPNRV